MTSSMTSRSRFLRTLLLATLLQMVVFAEYWHFGDDLSFHGGSAPPWAFRLLLLIELPVVSLFRFVSLPDFLPDWAVIAVYSVTNVAAWALCFWLLWELYTRIRGRGLTSA